jgi:type I restriction enzyme S subunit
MNMEIPHKWVKTNLGEILELKYGKALPAKTRDGKGAPVYGSNGIVGNHSLPLIKTPGIIIGRKGSFGEVNIVNEPFSPIDTTYYIDELFNQPIKYWFYQLIKLPLTTLNRSTAIPGLNREDAYSQEVLLPSLAEQNEIVTQLDKLLAQVESTKVRLDAIPLIIKRFRQSVLASAVSSKLTEEWRKENKVSQWKNEKLCDVAGFQNGYAFKSSWFTENGSHQVIKLGNVKNNYLKLEATPAFVTSELAEEYSKFEPKFNDILITMTGTKYKKDYGYTCIIPEDAKVLINQRVGRIITKEMTPYFLHIFLQSDYFLDQFFAGETGGVNQGNVGSDHIKNCRVLVPDLTEQNEINRIVEQLLAFADKVEEKVNAAQERVNSLTQSLLAKAFRGELTAKWRAQNPDLISGENSAATLLEKIKVERSALTAKNKPKKTTARKAKA